MESKYLHGGKPVEHVYIVNVEVSIGLRQVTSETVMSRIVVDHFEF